MLIGDGHISGRERDPTFIFEHSVKQADYAEWKANLIDNIFIEKQLSKRCKRRQTVQTVKGKSYEGYRVALYWKEYCAILRKRCYIFHNKSEIKNIEYILSQMESDLHLAIWFGDDGGEVDRRPRKTCLYKPRYGLYTYGFTEGQNNLTIEWFKYRHNLKPEKIYFKPRNSFYLKFSRDETDEIYRLISPHLKDIHSMRNKFINSFAFFTGEGPETKWQAPVISG